MNKIAIIVPAYNPSEKLIKLVDEIIDRVSNTVIIINDGSKAKYNYIFEEVKTKVNLIKNNKNMGKGYSLKRGMKFLTESGEDNLIGIITVDADGQHCIKDIESISKKLEENYIEHKEKVILGKRNFKKSNVPIKNRLGNKIASTIFKKRKGILIQDTQTGLRGIPFKYLEEFIKLSGDRYEYEQNMLGYIVKNDMAFEEIEIETIYNKNKSNFNTIIDSYKIIKSILKRIK